MNENIQMIIRFLVFVCFLGSCLWSANMAYATTSAGFGFLSFFLFIGAVSQAATFEKK
jgi:hypothetical protein